MVGGKHILEELSRRVFPTEAKRVRPRRRAVEIERLERRRPQVGAENGSPRIGEDVKRTGRRISGDGKTGGERFEQHEAERVGHARKDEPVGRGVSVRKRLAFKRTGEKRIRVKA